MNDPLQKILGPVSREEFLEDYWQKQSLLVQDRDEDWPFSFDRKSFFDALPESYHLKTIFKDEEGQHTECEIEPEQARKMYKAGQTLCATRINSGNPSLQRYVRALEGELLGSEFQTNAYLSPSGSGFGVHYDYHSVWILQLEGTKQWYYADEPTVEYPVANCVYPLDRDEFEFPWYTVSRPDESTFNEVVLEPGDMLYLPTGAWHKTQANGYSLSITLGHEPVRASEFVTDRLMDGIWNEEASRRHLPFVPQSGDDKERSKEELRNALGDALETLQERMDDLTVDRLLNAWNEQIEAQREKRRSARQQTDAGNVSPSALLALFGQTEDSSNKTDRNGHSESSSNEEESTASAASATSE